MVSKIFSELKTSTRFNDFGDNAMEIWTRTLSRRKCTEGKYLRAAINAYIDNPRYRPTPGQFCDFYHEAMRKDLGIPTVQFVTNTLLSIFKASKDAAKKLIADLSPFVYRVYRGVDITWLRETNQNQREYEKEIKRIYDEVVDIAMHDGPDAKDQNGNREFVKPRFIEDGSDDHKRAMKKRPKNWQETEEFKKGKERLAAMKSYTD